MDPYVSKLKEQLLQRKNEAHSIPMTAYMRHQFAFLGIRTPERTAFMRQFFKENGLPTTEQLPNVVMQLWACEEREFQYCAMSILHKMKKHLTMEHIPLIEHIITTASWWDTVDLIASHYVGEIARKFPVEIQEVLDRWNKCDHLWLNRTTILYQLSYKEKTNEQQLYTYCLQHAQSDEFFHQKAIGWALREYSKTNKESVIHFISHNELKPLSVREGMKMIRRRFDE